MPSSAADLMSFVLHCNPISVDNPQTAKKWQIYFIRNEHFICFSWFVCVSHDFVWKFSSPSVHETQTNLSVWLTSLICGSLRKRKIGRLREKLLVTSVNRVLPNKQEKSKCWHWFCCNEKKKSKIKQKSFTIQLTWVKRTENRPIFVAEWTCHEAFHGFSQSVHFDRLAKY